MKDSRKFFSYSIYNPKSNSDFVNVKNLVSSKTYSEFIMRLGLIGLNEIDDIEILTYMVSSAVSSENFDFIDTVGRAIRETNMFDKALKRGGKKFLNLCGRYIAKNYSRANKTYFVNMCRVVCSISDKFSNILGKDW